MMRVPGRKFARRILRPVSKALFPGAIIIGYHRVADSEWDPLGLAVSPGNFESQLDILMKLRDLVTVGELALRHAAGEPLERYAALTFDDGYDDFAETVLPIIESRAMPATVFVTTGFVERSFWWDEVASLLTPTGQPAPALEVLRNGGNGSWHFSDLDDPEKRAAAARTICESMACGKQDEIRHVVGQLRAWGSASGTAHPDSGPMSSAQLESLALHPLVELGAHTVSHGCLALLEPEAQRNEISQSKAALEALRGIAVTVFSYPNGSFSETTRDLVEALGFRCACTSIEGAFHRRTDPYRIPRIWAPDGAGPAFRRWLGNWIAETR
jgi:peptidoglycan/xylan/chitin deacetylase (PgdA/CDA1 family)